MTGGAMQVLAVGSLMVQAIMAASPSSQLGPNWVETTENALVPPEIKPSGEHGTVVLEGRILPGGQLSDVQVARTSQSAAIDAWALARYGKARLGSELLLPGKDHARLIVAVYNTAGLDFGQSYSCAQAVLDSDWYARVSKSDEVERTPLYRLVRAGALISSQPKLSFANNQSKLEEAWRKATNACRSVPDQTFMRQLLIAGNKR